MACNRKEMAGVQSERLRSQRKILIAISRVMSMEPKWSIGESILVTENSIHCNPIS